MTATISAVMAPVVSGLQSLEVLYAVSLAADQLPTGTGDSNKINIEFGAAQFTASDPVMIDVNGVVTFNESGLYWLKPEATLGRVGGAGESNLLFRALVNGAQTSIPTAGFLIDDQKIKFVYSEVTWVYIPVAAIGTTIELQMCRDADGNDSGGLYKDTVTASGWNASSCATLQILKFI